MFCRHYVDTKMSVVYKQSRTSLAISACAKRRLSIRDYNLIDKRLFAQALID